MDLTLKPSLPPNTSMHSCTQPKSCPEMFPISQSYWKASKTPMAISWRNVIAFKFDPYNIKVWCHQHCQITPAVDTCHMIAATLCIPRKSFAIPLGLWPSLPTSTNLRQSASWFLPWASRASLAGPSSALPLAELLAAAFASSGAGKPD